jgi:hypothetical protein
MNRYFLDFITWPVLEGLPAVSVAEQARLCRVKRDIEKRILRTLMPPSRRATLLIHERTPTEQPKV